ncbi:LVIS_2131 family protein [Lapidilactobacillus mulanensis]|uniref:LVIS_2131 family protein n=1 Tax=Lapidilactobacillus mulanensis TaxID=2485999 RepID=A0ABW4DMN1_9LACO|nr:LVIS_2131 family protein [Lapidilactobacillus mulanensis]
MNSAWNWIGLGAWFILLVFLIFIVQNIRHRHIKMIVMTRRTFSFTTFLLDLLLVAIFIGGLGFMSYQTFFRHVDVTDQDLVSVKYSTVPLVLQTNGGNGYFVTVEQGEGRTPIQKYTYWTQGNQYQVKSIHASIATGEDPITIGARVYRFPSKMIKNADKKYEAFVATVRATYKPTFLNGLGMRVGHNALDYTMIRVPSSVFVSK